MKVGLAVFSHDFSALLFDHTILCILGFVGQLTSTALFIPKCIKFILQKIRTTSIRTKTMGRQPKMESPLSSRSSSTSVPTFSCFNRFVIHKNCSRRYNLTRDEKPIHRGIFKKFQMITRLFSK